MDLNKYDAPMYLKNINRKYRLIDNAEALINDKSLMEAEKFYLQLLNHELFINDYYPFLKLSQIYRQLQEYEKETDIIKDFFTSNRYCSDKTLNYFQNRLEELSELDYFDYSTFDDLKKSYDNLGFKNKDLIAVPVLSAKIIKNINFPQLILDYKFFKDLLDFDEEASLKFKIKLKYKIIKKGEELLDNFKLLESIDYFYKVSKLSLFENDVYPFLNLSNTFKKLNQPDFEKNIILDFFNSKIYCDGDEFDYFMNRLIKLNHQKLTVLDDDYLKELKFNKDLSNIPVPSSKVISEYYKPLNRCIGESTIIESLISEIPKQYLDDFEKSHIDIDEDADFDFNDDSKEVFKLTSVSDVNLKERILMINVLNLIKSGKTRSQAANILDFSVLKIYKWFDKGKRRASLNSFYFYTKFVKLNENAIDSKYLNNYNLELPSENMNLGIIDDKIDNDLKVLLDEYDDFLGSDLYKKMVNRFNISNLNLEIIKNNILDDMLKRIIKGKIDFEVLFNDYYTNFKTFEFPLRDEDFDAIFDEVDESEFREEVIFDSRLRTVNDFYSGLINQNAIKSRYISHLKKINKEVNQLARLEDIKINPNVPGVKKFLSDDEKENIYQMTEDLIKSEHGLNVLVLDFVRYSMNSIVNKNKKEAFKKFNNIKDKNNLMRLTKLNERQVNDFIHQFEFLIQKNKIQSSDITVDFVRKLGLNFMPSRKIIL